MATEIYGFAGPAGSGKDTCGKILIEKHGFERVSFAAPIYDALEAMGFGRPATQEEKERVIPGIGKSWRQMAQTLGTEWGREKVNPDLWIILALQNLKPNGKYVFTDVRFENEAELIRKAGGHVVHLTGGRKSNMTSATAFHASEASLRPAPPDWYILNADHTVLPELEGSLASMLGAHRK